MSTRNNQRTTKAGEGQYLAGVGLAPYPSSRTQADIKLQQNWCPACASRQIEGFSRNYPIHGQQRSSCHTCNRK